MTKLICENWIMKACAVLLLSAAAAIALPAQTPAVPSPTPVFTRLHSFNYTDGANPEAGLVQATDGYLYGTTTGGSGGGTIFKIAPNGGLTTIYTFCSQNNCPDGATPRATLIQANQGNLYGTTSEGGAHAYDGTAFTITLSGRLRTLHSFCSNLNSFNCMDGSHPDAGLVQGADGNFYGTTADGAAIGACAYPGCGTVFKITSAGTLTTLHRFGFTDGAVPCAGLVQGPDGNFYGTTEYGGPAIACSQRGGCGTVFKITPSGTLTTLHNFDGRDGFAPRAGLVQGADGNFYGTTYFGGTYNSGTVFRITPNGMLTTLHSFGGTDGGAPDAGLVQGTDGNFYGTTYGGGTYNGGTAFKISPGGALTTLYSFCSRSNCTDGFYPNAGLVQGTSGKFYGTTYFGGSGTCGSGCGTIFSVSVGLAPFVETQPTSGVVGKEVNILGTNLTGATSVTFNGTPATFMVVSKSRITTTVPLGATTGRVHVVGPRGTLKSNVPFRVR